MTMQPEMNNSLPRRRWWPWIVVCVFVLIVTTFSFVAYRNQQQWSKASRLVRQLERSGGKGTIFAHYGTDFCRIGDSWVKSRFKEVGWQRIISWPEVHLVHLLRSDKPISVDWTLLEDVEVPSLAIHHPQFSDADLEDFPNENTLEAIHLNSPLITNRCLQKLEQFTSLAEVSTTRSSIDGTALLKFVQNTNILVAPRLTTTELVAFSKAGLQNRIGYLEIVADRDFDTSKLKGLLSGGRLTFRGRYNRDSFVGLDSGPVRPNITFEDAEFHAESLVDVAKMPRLNEVEISNCVILGEIESTIRNSSSSWPLRLLINVSDTNFRPSLLRAFGGRRIVLEYTGEFADDAWVDELVQIAGVEEIDLIGTRVSEAKAAQYSRNTATASGIQSRPVIRHLYSR